MQSNLKLGFCSDLIEFNETSNKMVNQFVFKMSQPNNQELQLSRKTGQKVTQPSSRISRSVQQCTVSQVSLPWVDVKFYTSATWPIPHNVLSRERENNNVLSLILTLTFLYC